MGQQRLATPELLISTTLNCGRVKAAESFLKICDQICDHPTICRIELHWRISTSTLLYLVMLAHSRASEPSLAKSSVSRAARLCKQDRSSESAHLL
jgi:hypothetical protein